MKRLSNAFSFMILFAMMIAFSLSSFLSQPKLPVTNSAPATASFVASRPADNTMATPDLDKKERRALIKAKKKEIREKLRAAREEYKKNRKESVGSIIGKVIGAVMLCGVALVAFYGVAMLSGYALSGFVSGIVKVLGVGIIIVGLFFGLRAIFKKRKDVKT